MQGLLTYLLTTKVVYLSRRALDVAVAIIEV